MRHWIDRVRLSQWFAGGGLLISAFVHLWIAPDHFQHAPAHGLFFGFLGVVQLVWVALWIGRPRAKVAFLGVVLSGGVIVLWLLTQTVAIPFADDPEPLDAATMVSKCSEAVAFVYLLIWLVIRPELSSPERSKGQRTRAIGQVVATSLVSGFLLFSGGFVAAPYLPGLAHQAGADHNHADGSHSHESVEVTPSAAALAVSAYPWDLPRGFPLPTIPTENPITEEKVALGRYLFYDTRLSGNGTQSCSTCHLQALAFTDGRAVPVGSTGEAHVRSAQTLVNVGYNPTLTWANPVLTSLERQIPVPMFGEFPIELGITGNEEGVLERFRTDEQYQQLFTAAFPDDEDPYTWQSIVYSLASFIRTLISGNSAYDRYTAGDESAISRSAQRGMSLFFSEALECHHCHTGFNFSASTTWQGSAFVEKPFFNTGLYNVDGAGGYPTGNTGVREVSNRPEDMGRFRPPTLRNIALTAPYMHDGSLATLEEVIRMYGEGGLHRTEGDHAGDGRANPYKSGLVAGFEISDQELSDLVAFLNSLTDEEFISDPRFGNPFAGQK